MGLFLLSIGLVFAESLLNYTGYIVKVLSISNFAEPLNFAMAPLYYLFVREKIKTQESKNDWLHFIPLIFWLFYCIPYFMQSDIFKYNSYVDTMKPEWPYVNAKMIWHEDYLGIRSYINIATFVQFVVYIVAIVRLIIVKSKLDGGNFFKVDDTSIQEVRNSTYHLLAIVIIFAFVKLYFGRDLGDHFIGLYITFMVYMTTIQIIRASNYFEHSASIFDLPMVKYQKSSLLEHQKDALIEKIRIEMGEKRYYLNNLASVSGLSKKIGESSHHVSQVINERMNKSFFELLAYYRVKEAKRILLEDKLKKYTVEELADAVGYNSKSAFNNAFKKFSGQTPSGFRKTNGIT